MRYTRITKTLIDFMKDLSKETTDTEQSKTSLYSLKGVIVIIAEKPKAARKIVDALRTSYSVRQYRYHGIPYWILQSPYSKTIVAPSAGHLFGLTTELKGYPVFSYSWKPLYVIEKNSLHTKKFIELFEKVCRNADYYINACDYDIEGSVIGYLIIKHFGDPKRSFRVKFSSLTPIELRESFNNIMPLDWNMIEAGLCRHELDWIWGINVSRALMDSVKFVSGKKVILSAGRVQTPTLKFVVDREIERNLFIPIPRYTISISVIINDLQYSLEYQGPLIETKDQASDLVENIRRNKYLVVTDYLEHTKKINPPPPFNLGDLQEEAAKIYGFSPYKTQAIAEQLYLNAYISYPRTNSQKLPPTLNYKQILQGLSKIHVYNYLVRSLLQETGGILKPVEGPKEDPAHPAIYPTGIVPEKLRSDEQKIYDLIVRRFLAVFARPAVISHRTIVFHPVGLKDKNIKFVLRGLSIISEGWMKYYPFHKPEEVHVPRLQIGAKVLIKNIRVKRVFTKPPEKLTKIKILRWMEENNIGTESTRARIIELLFDRGYLKSSGGKTEATNLGMGLIEVVSEYFNELTSIELTRKFEDYMNAIRNGKRRRNEVIEEAKNTLMNLINKFNEKKKEIGIKLSWRLGLLKPPKHCILCDREVYNEDKQLCKYHYEAFLKVKDTYIEWRKRENIDWHRYLKELKRLSSTGKWVKDVVSKIDQLL